MVEALSGPRGIGILDRELEVGDKSVRGEAGGEFGKPICGVKKGNGAMDTSSSSVHTLAVGEPREEAADNVGLEIRPEDDPRECE